MGTVFSDGLGLSCRASRGQVAELRRATPAKFKVWPPTWHVLWCSPHVPLTASHWKNSGDDGHQPKSTRLGTERALFLQSLHADHAPCVLR